MKKLKILLQSNVFYVFLFLILCFYVFYFTKIKKYFSYYPDSVTELILKIDSFHIDGDKLSLLLKKEEKVQAIYYIPSLEDKQFLEKNLKIGQTIKVQGEKQKIIGQTIPNTFDYKKYLYHERIYFSFLVNKIEIMNQPSSILDKIKNKIEERIRKLGNNAYLKAFILGDKGDLEPNHYQKIVSNGVSHLFALSGMHVSLVYLLLNKLLKKFKYKKGIIYSFLFCYLTITGYSISFLRAILFLILLDGNKKFNLQLSNIKILFLTAFILLWKEPFYIFNIGFWYTFLVTFSLLFCNEWIKNKGKIKQIILISLITFLFSFPITIFMNYEINILSIFNNVFMVPFVSTLVFPLALLTFILPVFLPIFQFFIGILEYVNLLFSYMSINLIFGKISLIEIGLYYVLLIVGMKYTKKMFFFFFLFLLFIYNKNLFEKDYFVYFIDVGQGDATLFVSPQKKEAILIDTGGQATMKKEEYQTRKKEFSLADNLITFFKSIRVRKINLLLLTHGDLDHLGYAKEIGEKMKIHSIMINEGKINKNEQSLIDKFPSTSNYQFKYFKYQKYKNKIYDNENDNSVVTKWQIYSYSFLMMGDASKKVEKELIAKEGVSATFLKVGHHGSKTSSDMEFLEKVNPKYAIISSGRKNRFHHPAEETVSNLKKLDTIVFNTQETGTICVKINKSGYHISKTLS